jgi:hypothetical protein
VNYRFEFHGGFKGGQTVADDVSVRVYLFLTDGGRVGTRFRDNPPPNPEAESALDEFLAARSKHPLTAEDERHALERFQKRLLAIEGELGYEYEVARRVETEDEVIVHLEVVRSAGSSGDNS